ncbi:MAG: RDD family protein [Cellulomonadaceae bacterium]|nr:RDD family protein [Cellulomonadaceae bacterium]
MSEEILIGEGVLLDARPASFATRSLGALIDLAAIVAVGLVVMWVVIAAAVALDEAALAAMAVTAVVVVLIGIPTTVETLTRGRSLGKLAMGLRIVRDDGGPIRFRHAFIRALTGVLELWISGGAIAVITSLVNPQGKRLGDLLAGTYSVRVRGGQKAMAPLVMPAELAGWAHHADIRRLPDGLALSARQFLGRAGRLHAGSRARLGASLAADIETYVAPGPPRGTHPERFIAAVLAERRDREYTHAMVVARRSAAEQALVARLPHAVPDPR